ncbi:MAG: hypothetical protein EOP85_11760, partial [Verrucomicrobiaceae bacterium]
MAFLASGDVAPADVPTAALELGDLVAEADAHGHLAFAAIVIPLVQLLFRPDMPGNRTVWHRPTGDGQERGGNPGKAGHGEIGEALGHRRSIDNWSKSLESSWKLEAYRLRTASGQDFAGFITPSPSMGVSSPRPCVAVILHLLRASMFRFSVFGIPVEVQPFFWITLVILGGASRADSEEAIFKIVLFVLAGFISILVHELGHALTARRFGSNVHIVLQAFGGYAAYSGARISRKQSFLITAAGPAIQIALGVLVLVIARFIPHMDTYGAYFLRMLAFISIAWAILNLLPVVPLDGGQMLHAVLGPARIKVTLWVTIITAIA